jgi:hypothetical protein
VLHLRGALGTRIELCYLFVHISLGTVPNLWPTSRQVHARPMSHPHTRVCDTLTALCAPTFDRCSCNYRTGSLR